MHCLYCDKITDDREPHLCVSETKAGVTIHYYTPDPTTPLIEHMMAQAIEAELKKVLDIS